MSRLAKVLFVTVALSLAATAADAAARKKAGQVAPAAGETALVGLHELRREGGKTCMSEHEHYGSSSGQPTRKAAEVAAMQSWAGFTAWEYGGAWGNPALAGSKQMKCSGKPGSFACDFAARPCRR